MNTKKIEITADDEEILRHALANFIVDVGRSTEGLSLPPDVTAPLTNMKRRAVMILDRINAAFRQEE
jgi:hypothetical protein